MNPSDTQAIIKALNDLVQATKKGPWEYTAICGGIATLGVLIWYTIETYRLRLAAQQQSHLGVMPVLAVEKDTIGGSGKLILTNVGVGPALNLSIDKVTCNDGAKLDMDTRPNVEVMRQGDREPLSINHWAENTGNMLDSVSTLYTWVAADRLPKPLRIVVRCTSVDSLQYVFTFACTVLDGHFRIKYEGYKIVG